MKVLLLGASGFSGLEVLKQLLLQNHTVTAISRNKSSISIQDNSLKILIGNVLDEGFVQESLRDQDAVINCLGIGGKGNGEPNDLVSSATQILVESMEESSTRRLICMSNVGAGDSMKARHWIFTRFILPYIMKWLQAIIDDKNTMEPIVMNSDLDWTILRLPNITDKRPKGKVHVSLDGRGLKMSIANKDLAEFMVAQLDSSELIHQAPSVSN